MDRALNDLQVSTATVMFADIADYMGHVQRDERTAVERMRRLLIAGAAEVVPAYGGELIQRTGDELMLRFGDARSATQCANALHAMVAAENAGQDERHRLYLRIGIHSAEILSDETALYGHGVNLTSRIRGLARPGETLLSSSARDQLIPALDGAFEDLGAVSESKDGIAQDTKAIRCTNDLDVVQEIGRRFVKHVDEAIRVYRVVSAGHAPDTTPLRTTLAPVLAVLPFEPYEGTGPGLVVGDVLTDQLICALSTSSSVTLVSRLSSHALRGRTLSTRESASALGAHYALSGRYHLRDGRVFLQAELVATEDMQVLWADSIIGAANDALAPDSDLVMRIASAVAAATLRHEIAGCHSRPLPSLAAHTLHLAAISSMHRFSLPAFKRAHAMLEALHERVPRHPAPVAWLARWHMLRVVQGWTDDERADGERAVAYADHALDLDPDSSLTLMMAGCARRSVGRDMDGAQLYFDRALAANPNEALAWLFKGTIHGLQGEHDVAIEATDRALAMSPLDPMRPYYESLSASASTAIGEYARAIALATRALRGNAMHASTYRTLAISLGLTGRWDEARRTIARLLEVDPTSTMQDFRMGDRSPHNEMLVRALVDAGMPQTRRSAGAPPGPQHP